MVEYDEEIDFEEEDEDSIPMFTGENISILNLLGTMFNIYKGNFEEGKSPITYLEEGGEARNILEAVAYIILTYFFFLNQMALNYFIPHANGDNLDILGEDNLRKSGDKSSGGLLFKLPDEEVKEYPITIPAYTPVITEDDSSLEFETIEEAILPAGENNILVNAQSLYGGSEYNVESKIVTVLEEDIDDLEVNNPEPFVGGTDDEDDESYRARLLEEKDSLNFGSLEWFKEEAEKIEGVIDAKIINRPNNVDFTVEVIVNPPTENIINNINDYFAMPNNTPGGIKPYISGAEIILFNIILEDVTYAPNVNPTDVDTEINKALLNYQKTDLKIDKNVIRNNILTILSKVDGLIYYNLTSPADDLSSDENTVFVIENITINH